MKVRELQEKLSEFDPELNVLFYSEDHNVLVKGRGFVLFDIETITKTEAEIFRLDDGTPYLKFEKGKNSKPVLVLESTSDF